MGDERSQPCTQEMMNSHRISDCRTPVLFHRPTAIQVLDDQTDTNRTVSVLAHASTPAFIASNTLITQMMSKIQFLVKERQDWS